jgi:hypothetical protein
MYGRRQSGKSLFQDNQFFVDDTQYYMYKKITQWFAIEPFCFVAPLPKTKTYIYKPFTHEPLMGIMKYTCPSIELKGIKIGDIVTFMPDSEYSFRVDENKLYRIRSKNIIAYEPQRN